MISILRKYWEGFKKRWSITSDRQVVVILIVFTLTGTTTMYVDSLVDQWIGLGKDSSFWLKLLVFLVIVLPLYNGLLLVYGALLGQLKFFKYFVVKFFTSIFKMLHFRKKK